jgi:glutaminyl-tRNA synthetase
MANNFIEEIIEKDLASGAVKTTVTRFPPEPNGYLHIGHVKSLCINYGVAKKYGGKFYLRFDDTNPSKEEQEYVAAIKSDLLWLGFKWDKLTFSSAYFDKMYECALLLIKKGLAYVCDLNQEQIKEYRGTLTERGKNSPYRNRAVEENLDLFIKMKEGAYPDNAKVLRAKIDMASPNINMRDPIIYRIMYADHHNTGGKWCIYPMYDFAHPIEDAVEKTTHSLCSLEFEDHRPLYEWVIDNCGFVDKPRQIEFARLNIKNTIMSKRYLKKLVDDGFVDGWSDPRMPTVSGMKRRGIPPQAIKEFCERAGVAKSNGELEGSALDFCIRENLNQNANRVMAVTSPIKLILTNSKGGEIITVENNPNKPESGGRKLSFSNELYIDGGDFSLDPPPKYHRLQKDGVVRLKGAYIIKCDEVVLRGGVISHLNCTYYPQTRSGSDNSGIKAKGVIQWVDAKNYAEITLNNFESLLNDQADDKKDFTERLNADSKKTVAAYGEASLLKSRRSDRFQFMRMGYYCLDEKSDEKNLIFNRIVGLKDGFK